MRKARQRITSAQSEKSGYAYFRDWVDGVYDYCMWQNSVLCNVTNEDEYFAKLSSRYAEDSTYVSKLKDIIKKEKLKTKSILHCWGGVINLHSSFELASLFKREIEMVEVPIVDFSLNNNYISKLKILKSKLNINYVDRKNLSKFYQDHIKNNLAIKKNRYEFKFK
jgi:hypothetical protein